MVKKVQYHNQDERQQLIEENSALTLIEEANITEGDFLIFTDTPPPPISPKPTYEELENQLLLLTDSLSGGIL